MHRTVDHIAAGRVILGIGSGWFEKDFVEYGYEFGTAGSRVRDLARDLPVIRRRLAALNPPPVRPVPILVAGTGEKVMLRLVAEHANIWNAIGDPETVAHKASVLDDWCATVGRDPKEIQRSVYMTDLERHPEDYVASGFTQFVYDVPPPYDVTVMRDLLAWRDGRNAATNASAGTG
jgi:alkanesulfonate monooxygenase SsuD/methylene tetrahydromethanopterin reductase-like flavin-dependent oxidoreductase (luciferase family)